MNAAQSEIDNGLIGGSDVVLLVGYGDNISTNVLSYHSVSVLFLNADQRFNDFFLIFMAMILLINIRIKKNPSDIGLPKQKTHS